MPQELVTLETTLPPASHALYINASYAIEVDAAGFCISTVYEGALGMVVQVHDAAGQHLALKIPRLIADTHRENAHIARLMEKERDTVLLASSKGAGNNGLLEAQRATPGVLEKQIHFETPIDDAQKKKQANGFLLVQFSKGKAPRFVNVRRGEKGAEIYPPEALKNPELQQFINFFSDSEFWENCEDLNLHRNKLRFAHILTFPSPAQKDGISVHALDPGVDGAAGASSWYAFLPSLLFEWCASSFQQDIQESGCTAGWSLSQQLEFCQRILRGIIFLHSDENKPRFLHGDIRPANILYHHSTKTREPAGYSLIDYGSLNQADIMAGNGGGGSNTSIPGPTVIPTRYSIFYSEERGQAEEKEFGEVVVWKHTDRYNIVMVAWRDLTPEELAPEFERYETEMISLLEEREQAAGNETEGLKNPGPGHWPAKGDSVRIRDYVFVIRKGAHFSPAGKGLVQVFLCDHEYYKVVHNSLSVRVDDSDEWQEEPSGALRRMSISRVTQMKQVGPAADLYSFGVLVLYVLYWNGKRRKNGETVKEERQKVEGDFKEIVSAMASKAWMNQIWRRLDAMCHNLEQQLPKIIRSNLDPTKVDWEKMEKGARPELDFDSNDSKWKSVADDIKSTVELILINIPSTSVIYESLTEDVTAPGANGADINKAKNPAKDSVTFLFLIHYVMCCLHRKDHMPKNETSVFGKPFCANRLRDVNANWEGSKAAMARLNGILQHVRLEMPPNSHFQAKPDAKPEDPFYEQIQRLKREVEEHETLLKGEKDKCNKISSSLNEQSVALAKANARKKELEDSLHQTCFDYENALSDLKTMNERIRVLAHAGGNIKRRKSRFFSDRYILSGTFKGSLDTYLAKLRELERSGL
jgi:serine/threonine protein kinase